MVARHAEKRKFRPGKLYIAKAYPAIEQKRSTSAVCTVDTNMLFQRLVKNGIAFNRFWKLSMICVPGRSGGGNLKISAVVWVDSTNIHKNGIMVNNPPTMIIA